MRILVPRKGGEAKPVDRLRRLYRLPMGRPTSAEVFKGGSIELRRASAKWDNAAAFG